VNELQHPTSTAATILTTCWTAFVFIFDLSAQSTPRRYPKQQGLQPIPGWSAHCWATELFHLARPPRNQSPKAECTCMSQSPGIRYWPAALISARGPFGNWDFAGSNSHLRVCRRPIQHALDGSRNLWLAASGACGDAWPIFVL